MTRLKTLMPLIFIGYIHIACSQDYITIQKEMIDPGSFRCSSHCQYKFKSGEPLTGNFIIHYENNSQQKGTFKDGYREGTHEFYNYKGILIKKTEYCQGDYCGIREEYTDKGKRMFTYNYNREHKLNGLKTIYYGESYGPGELVSETIEYVNDVMEGKRTSYDPEGNLWYVTDYSGNEKNGEEISYYEKTGKVKSITHYKNGIKDGQVTAYFNSGEVEFEGWVKEGKSHGTEKRYNDQFGKAKLWSERNYKDGLLHGLYREYDLSTKLTTVSRDRYYWNDEEVTKEVFESRSNGN